MTDDYGKKMGKALAAVRQMYEDVSKLLREAEVKVAKGESIFGNVATRGVSAAIYKPHWMPGSVSRYYAPGEGADPAIVEALAVWFADPVLIEEPHLIVGQIAYRLEGVRGVVSLCDPWDLTNAYITWGGPPEAGRVRSAAPAEGRVLWHKTLGTPLYSVTSVDHVVELMGAVRSAPAPETIL